MKALRIVFNAVCFIGIILAVTVAMGFDGGAIEYKVAVLCILLAVFVFAICGLGNWIITDHQRNLEELKELPPPDSSQDRGTTK